MLKNQPASTLKGFGVQVTTLHCTKKLSAMTGRKENKHEELPCHPGPIHRSLSTAVPALANNLHLVSDSSQNVGGEDVYPYNFNVNGASNLTALMGLYFHRSVTFGETWNANIVALPLDNSQSSIDYRADAWIFSQLGAYSNADVQYAVWDIFDPKDVNGHTGF